VRGLADFERFLAYGNDRAEIRFFEENGVLNNAGTADAGVLSQCSPLRSCPNESVPDILSGLQMKMTRPK
jgi:hypothetical protein